MHRSIEFFDSISVSSFEHNVIKRKQSHREATHKFFNYRNSCILFKHRNVEFGKNIVENFVHCSYEYDRVKEKNERLSVHCDEICSLICQIKLSVSC